MTAGATAKPDYGVDAPGVIRNLFVSGGICLLLAIVAPHTLHVGGVDVSLATALYWPAGSLLLGGVLMLVYVKFGKFRHRDLMLKLRPWTGAERVLDVGCGRGLLLAAAAKRLTAGGHATGIDIWSNVDMAGNSAAATQRNLDLEGIAPRCTLLDGKAQALPFADASVDVVLSNLCLHNIAARDERRAAVAEIARVLAPGGIALVSDFRNTGEYARDFRRAGLDVGTQRGSWLTTFPPLTVVIARKGG
ncbi:MAG: class I SAM-dependent methyltransferase [Vulcanimicrobiaceae bacterium]|jgi:SAM-dependent methyltransferase